MVWNLDPGYSLCRRHVEGMFWNWLKTKERTGTWQIEHFLCYVVLLVHCFFRAHLQSTIKNPSKNRRWILIAWNVWCFPDLVQEGSTSTNLLSRERKGLSRTAGPGLDHPKELSHIVWGQKFTYMAQGLYKVKWTLFYKPLGGSKVAGRRVACT